MNHFSNGNSQREIAEIIRRNHSTVQRVIERYKKENRLTSRVGKSAKKVFRACDERWVLRQIKTNPELRVTQPATEIENHRRKNVNPETLRHFKEY